MPRQRADNFPRGVRNHLLRASGGRCQQCGSTGKLEVDHIVPARQGGRPEAANGQVLCWRCHRDKSARERGHVFVPDRCRHRHGRTFCCNTATLLEGWTKPGVALDPSSWRRWRRLCEDCAIHLLEYWASYGGVGLGLSFLPTFRPLSRGLVAWQVGTYQPDQWYAVMWDNLSGPWRVHTALGPFQAAREAQQAAQQMAVDRVAVLGRPSDSRLP